MLKRITFIPAILMMITLCGCEPQAPPTVAKAGPAPVNQELTAAEITQYLDGGNITLEPSPSRVISGDLRPLWIVTGKISNSYNLDIKSVKIRLTAYDNKAHTVLDTADVEVDDLPALSAKAFRREVPLMVQKGQFNFSYDFLSATVKKAN